MRRALWITAAVLVATALLLAILAAPALAGQPFPFPRNTMAPDGPDNIDGTYMLGEKEAGFRVLAATLGPAITVGSGAGNPAAVGEEITVTVSDSGLGTDYDETFVVVMDGTRGIILVTKDAYDSFDGTSYHFANPVGDDSSTWLRSEDLITTDQLAYLLAEFDDTIYPTDTSVFGEPLARGPEGRKVWILIHNIRDEAYYDADATTYVAGYFSSSEDAANSKNMMHIDSYDWINRTGPDSARPYLYEGVFAHEFEHLIHFDQDPDEESWVDEGLADLAGYLCGYGHSAGHVAYYMVYHPFTALTFWGGGLEDYGASYLFQLYLWEKYGGTAFTSALVQEQANGIAGVEATLAAFRAKRSFAQIFDDWTVANYIDDTNKGGGRYGYRTLDIGSIDSWGYTIPYALANFWWGPPDLTPFAYTSDEMYGAPMPYTAQYLPFNNTTKVVERLDGDDFAGTLPFSGAYEWYSGMEAWAWRSFHQSFAIPAGGATLTFMTWFDIEDEWDYAYVEVFDQDTGEWYTLDAAGTVNHVAYGQDNPNTPSGREPTDYEAAGRWHAFTGSSGGWVPVSMDLTPFAGHTIDLHFRSWQDGAFTLQMMYVDDISIPEIGFFDDAEAGEDGWTADGWTRTTGILSNGFGALTMDTKWVPEARYPEPADNSAMTLHDLKILSTDPVTQEGSVVLAATPAYSGRTQVAVIANHADHIATSGYTFAVSKK
ncbi:MAG: hypothetical protein ACYCX3_08490 [Thermoleophilia bacterium]